jgi:hypothetical protein
VEVFDLAFTRVRNGSQVKVTLRLTVSQSVSLCVKPHLGPMTRYLLWFGFPNCLLYNSSALTAWITPFVLICRFSLQRECFYPAVAQKRVCTLQYYCKGIHALSHIHVQDARGRTITFLKIPTAHSYSERWCSQSNDVQSKLLELFAWQSKLVPGPHFRSYNSHIHWNRPVIHKLLNSKHEQELPNRSCASEVHT